MKSSLGAQRYSWGPQRGPQGSKMRLGEGFVEALGKLWGAVGVHVGVVGLFSGFTSGPPKVSPYI